MKYFSEKLNRIYDTREACEKAENEAVAAELKAKLEAEKKAAEEKVKKEKAAAERKAMAAEVETARKEMIEAQKKYREAIEKFVAKFGSYHWSSNSADDVPTLFDIFNPVFKALL